MVSRYDVPPPPCPLPSCLQCPPAPCQPSGPIRVGWACPGSSPPGRGLSRGGPPRQFLVGRALRVPTLDLCADSALCLVCPPSPAFLSLSLIPWGLQPLKAGPQARAGCPCPLRCLPPPSAPYPRGDWAKHGQGHLHAPWALVLPAPSGSLPALRSEDGVASGPGRGCCCGKGPGAGLLSWELAGMQ